MRRRAHVGEQVLPAPSSALVLRRSGRPLRRLLTGPLAWCPVALEAQVGQEGRGTAHPWPGGHGRPGGTVRVWAQPQPRRTVVEELRHGSAVVIRPDAPRGGEVRVLGDEAEAVPGRPWARADAGHRAAGTDL